MDERILEYFAGITEEERQFLSGSKRIDRTLYMDGSRSDPSYGGGQRTTYRYDPEGSEDLQCTGRHYYTLRRIRK